MSPSSLFLLARPLSLATRNGPWTLALVAATQPAYHAAKFGLIAAAGGGAGLFAGAFAMALVGVPASLLALSFAALRWRAARQLRAALRPLTGSPGVQGVEALCAGHTSFWGPFARERTTTCLLLVRGTPPADPRFGEALEVPDASRVGVRLSLARPGAPAGSSGLPDWETDLAALLAGERLPEAAAAAWREALEGDSRRDGLRARLRRLPEGGLSGLGPRILRAFDSDYERGLFVEAQVLVPGRPPRVLGAAAAGAAVKDLAGRGPLGRLRRALGLPSTGAIALARHRGAGAAPRARFV